MNKQSNPKVFISYAHEDKQRFVSGLATKLRENGIDAWIDQWEILPGDSFVDKIFEEGIKRAEAMIVVISKNSVDRPWVREELNTGLIKRIEQQTRIIPVIIDDCEIPEALKSILWVKINNITDYEEEFNRIMMSIFGNYEKPDLGEPPAYARTHVIIFPNLTQIDSLVLRSICEEAIETQNLYLDTDHMLTRMADFGIPDQEIFDSLDILDKRGYIEATRAMGRKSMIAFEVRPFGLEQYAGKYIENYDLLKRRIALEILNKEAQDVRSIADALHESPFLVGHILTVFDQLGLIKVVREMGGGIHLFIADVSPELKRAFE